MTADKNKGNEGITTLKVYKETKSRLDRLKEHPRETYDEILKKMLFILNTLKKDSEKARTILRKIEFKVKDQSEYTGVYSNTKDRN